MSLLDFIKNNKSLLIRIDDIAENMNWQFIYRCEELFDKFNLKPLIGVIPDNKDSELLKYQKKENFWSEVRRWSQKGWEVSMHGYNHLYKTETNFKDFFGYGGKSEFYGLSYNAQSEMISAGLNVFKKNNLEVRSFFSPNHTYDLQTIEALKNNNIRYVIDGYGLFPFKRHGMIFFPQLFYREIMLPIGIQSTQLHINYWDEEYFKGFKSFIEKNHTFIRSFDQIIDFEENLLKKIINFSIEKNLKLARRFLKFFNL